MDAVLLFSFGGPEGEDDVIPFLQNVTAGRNIPPERLAVVGQHYGLFDGISPINGQNRALMAALEPELRANGIDLPLYWGNRNWHPLLKDTLAAMAADGHREIFALVTSAFGSPSGCRQYRDDLDEAVAELADESGGVLTITKSRLYWNHPGFINASEARLSEALASASTSPAPDRLVFTAHSVPSAWTATSPYLEQLQAAAAELARRCAPDMRWDLVFQSRSGPPSMPWLEPDICDHLRRLHEDGIQHPVVFPVGFVSDHMEVVYDLDIEASAVAKELGIAFTRVPTVGTHPL